MKPFTTILRALNEREEGHAGPLVPALAGAAGAIVLAIGAAGDSDVTAVIGGVILAVGLLGTTVLHHLTIEYEFFKRLDNLEKQPDPETQAQFETDPLVPPPPASAPRTDAPARRIS